MPEDHCICRKKSPPLKSFVVDSYKITPLERQACPDCAEGEELPEALECGDCGIRHRCNHKNTLCDNFKPICPHCDTVLNGVGYSRVLSWPSGVREDRIYECGQCRHNMFPETQVSENQLTITENEDMSYFTTGSTSESTIKTYQIEALKAPIEEYVELLPQLDEKVEAYNEHHEQAAREKITQYLETGKFTRTNHDTTEEVDHSELSLARRVDQVSRESSFLAKTARNSYNDNNAKQYVTALEALDGETVELSNREALDYLSFPGYVEDIKELIEKYTVEAD